MFEAGEGRTQIRVRSLWFLLTYASDLLPRLRSPERERIRAGLHDADLLDALARILVSDAEGRMRQALSSGHRPRSEPLTRIQGRVDHLATARGRLMESGRIHCDFTELTFDRPRYRYLLVTLTKLRAHLADPELRERCAGLVSRLERIGVAVK